MGGLLKNCTIKCVSKKTQTQNHSFSKRWRLSHLLIAIIEL